jgi:hypothetical protein
LAIAASVLVAGSLFFKDAHCLPIGSGGASGPTYQVDPLWPKPLPNHWILGSVTGLAVDSQDHIWLVHPRRGVHERDDRNRPQWKSADV